MESDVIAKAVRHLKREGRLAPIIKLHPKPVFRRRQSAYAALVRSIIFQQLSGKAAGSIRRKFLALYPGVLHPTPAQVLLTSDAELRGAGFSMQKVRYLRDLSEKFADGTLNPRRFRAMEEAALREHLMSIKGIGWWTTDMFLMFTLGRPDILPTGDLGIQKGMQRVCKLDALPNPAQMEELAEPWRPYRTIASWYLWRTIDTNPEGLDW